VYYENSVYGNISVTQRGEQFNFYESGLPMFSVPNPDISFNEEVIHFGMLYHPSPKKVLLIGSGIGGTLEQIFKHPVDEVHYAELDPLIIEAAMEYSPLSFLSPLNDPRMTVKHVDGRFLVKNVDETYDIVIVALPAPSTLQLNRLYTKEFYAEVASRLKLNGIFSTVIPSSETYLSRELVSHNRCIYETLNSVFDNVLIVPGDYNIMLASVGDQLINQDIDKLNHRF
jgi:spermidine synthase